MKNSIHQLCDELSKLTGFLNPDPIRSKASSTIKFLNQKNVVFPQTKQDSPIILAYSMIFRNYKVIKNFSQLINRLVDCIKNNIFASDALSAIMNLICSNINQFDIDSSLKLLQHITASILQNFPDLSIINSFFSTALAFLNYPDPIVSNTAYASFQQMLTLLIDTILNFKDFENINYKNYLKICQEKYGKIISGFKNPFYVILLLIFCDLSNLSENLKPNWLFNVKPPQDVMFILLSEIVQTYGEMIGKDKQLLSSFRLTIFDDVKYPNSIPYLITFITSFIDVDSTIGSTFFSRYFQKIQYGSNLNYEPIFFFHCFALQKNDIMLRYFTIWEGAIDLFVPLICALMNFISAPEIPLVFSMKQWKHNDVLASQKKFELTAIHEIIFAILSSFKSSDDTRVLEFLSKSSNALTSTVMSGIKYSDLSSFNVPQQALFDLCQIFSKLQLLGKVDKFEQIELIFSGLDDSQKELFLYSQKAKLWPKFVCKFIIGTPQICEDKWEFFINSAIINGISPTFSKKLSNITAMDVLYALLDREPFPEEYISEFMFSNIQRFEQLYPIFESYIDKMFLKNKFDVNVLKLYLSLMKNCFSQKTEIELLRTTATFLKSDIPAKYKGAVLKQLKDNIMFNTSEIKEGWISLFEAIRPSNFLENIKLLKAGYDILSFVSNIIVATIYFSQSVELIFLFIEQNIDESISISCFDLLTKIKRIENWDFILLHCAQILTDSRPAVADASCTTFFNILQNHEISPKIFTYFFDRGFFEILDFLDSSSMIYSHILIQLAKYMANFWELLLEHPTFQHQFVPLIIDKQRKTKIQVANFYLAFYSNSDVLSNSPDIEKMLSRSITSRISDLAAFFEMKKQKSILTKDSIELNEFFNNDRLKEDDEASLKELNSLTELVFSIIRQRTVKSIPENWMPMLAMILLAVPIEFSDTIREAFQRIPNLVFNSEDESSAGNSFNYYSLQEKVYIVESLSTIVGKIYEVEKRKMVVGVLLKIVEYQPRLIFSCSESFPVVESIPLINSLFDEIESLNTEISSKAIPVNSLSTFYSIESRYAASHDNLADSDEVDKNVIFECLVASLIHEQTKSKALEKIVDIFPSVDPQRQKQFIFIYNNDKNIVITIFKSFFDIDSTMFNIEVFDNCRVEISQALKILIDNWDKNDSKGFSDFAKYLREVKVPSVVHVGQDENDNSMTKELLKLISNKLNENDQNNY